MVRLLQAVALATGFVPAALGQGNFNNPVIYEDLADNEVIRVGSDYYMTASTMHYSPGAPVLHSTDLANWEYVGHSVPTLSWGNKYDLSGGRAYVKGIWASSLQYRASDKLFYWIGCIEFARTYVYVSSSPSGPWTQRAMINQCFYDCGLLFDGDTPYVAYGNTKISVAKLNSQLTAVQENKQVYDGASNPGTIEGSRFYKRNGQYYIWVTKPASQQWVLKGSSPMGSYTIKSAALNLKAPVAGAGSPHQGSLVDTPSGQWYYMAFIDNYPGGRMPVLAPVTWSSDGWPTVTQSGGGWGKSYAYPATAKPVNTLGVDTFNGTTLSHQYEWNHNPDLTKVTIGGGVVLKTATVTNDLYNARNTLTRRIHGPIGVGTVLLDTTSMADGDRAGLAVLRDSSAYIGVHNNGGQLQVVMVKGLEMDSNWGTTGTGTAQAQAAATKGQIWLRFRADVRPQGAKTAQFSYSTDGKTFTNLGGAFGLKTDWQFFMAYRYGIFNFATKALGGSVKVVSFESQFENASY